MNICLFSDSAPTSSSGSVCLIWPVPEITLLLCAGEARFLSWGATMMTLITWTLWSITHLKTTLGGKVSHDIYAYEKSYLNDLQYSCFHICQ